MPKRRELVAMADEEMWDFIESQKSIQVATINKDGSPHLTTLWFAVEDGKIVLETFTKSQKVVNLKRDPRIAVLVECGAHVPDVFFGEAAGAEAVVHEVHRLRVFDLALTAARGTSHVIE